jgi:hypothetical protein
MSFLVADTSGNEKTLDDHKRSFWRRTDQVFDALFWHGRKTGERQFAKSSPPMQA